MTCLRGEHTIEEAGGLEAYGAMGRAKQVKMSLVNMENRSQIVFD